MKGNKVKKIVLLAAGLLLTACASYDLQQAMRPDNRNILSKLPNMEPIFETKSLDKRSASARGHKTSTRLSNEFATLFRREVEKNLINEDGPVKGKLILDPIFVQDESTAWPGIISIPLFWGIPLFLGAPWGWNTSRWELELSVLDKNGKRIARYSGGTADTEYKAFYWGYTLTSCRKAAAFEGYKKALDDVIKQLQADIPTLSAKLK